MLANAAMDSADTVEGMEYNEHIQEALSHEASELAFLEGVTQRVTSALGDTPVALTSVDEFSGELPFQGWGEAGELWWYFRYRGDRARLSVGRRDPASVVVIDVRFEAVRGGVYGDPLRGWLEEDEAEALLIDLWRNLSPVG